MTKTLDVLDIGCGHGLIHSYLRDAGCRLTGIDVAENAIETARRRNPHVHYDVYDGSRLPYADETFDVLVTLGVMHHVAVDQRDTFVSEARRVLRPGGSFVIFEHNKLNPLVQWIVARIPFDRNAVLLTGWRAQKLVRAAGFREIDCRYILFFPFEAAALRRSKAIWVGCRWARSTASLPSSNVSPGTRRRCYKLPAHHVVRPQPTDPARSPVTDGPSDRRPRRSQSVPSPARRCLEPYCY